tara:strand:- start:5267 stop:5512 length:246 start_codon:yes stop_codon:yes gene_type:complete
MIKFFLVGVFFISCQKSWTISEQNDFLNRCKKNKIDNISLTDYESFCSCIMNNSAGISYDDFLKTDIDSDYINQLINSCID